MEIKNCYSNHTSHEGLVPKYMKNTYNSIARKLILKWAKNLNRHFTNDNIQRTNRYMKKSPISLVIRKVNIKITVSYYPTSVRVAIIKNPKEGLKAWLKWHSTNLASLKS
jgi:hypothetical protein